MIVFSDKRAVILCEFTTPYAHTQEYVHIHVATNVCITPLQKKKKHSRHSNVLIVSYMQLNSEELQWLR